MRIPRVQSFEFCDLPDVPAALRSLTPTFLEAAFRVTRSYAAVTRPLSRALRRAGARRIVDLGSGGGGPVLLLLDQLERREGLRVPAVLSDRFPDAAALAAAQRRRPQQVSVAPAPVDACAVPPALHGFRTLFQLLHHFPAAAARGVLRDAARQGAGIAVFEVTHRSVLGLLQILLLPFAVLLLTPFVRPLPLWRILLTYVVPIAPLVVTWDGLISVLRSYTPGELAAMTASIDGELAEAAGGARYEWEQGAAWRGMQKISWLIGTPAGTPAGTPVDPPPVAPDRLS